MKEDPRHVFGAWAFVMGIVIAIAIGVFSLLFTMRVLDPSITTKQIHDFNTVAYISLIVFGILIGVLINSGEKSKQYLISGIIILIVSGFGRGVVKGTLVGIKIGSFVSTIFSAIAVLFVPITIIAAIKTVFNLDK